MEVWGNFYVNGDNYFTIFRRGIIANSTIGGMASTTYLGFSGTIILEYTKNTD